MRKMPVLLINLFGFSCGVGYSAISAGDTTDFQYFKGKDIDYWNEGKLVKNHLSFNSTKSKLNKDKQSLQNHFSGSNTIRAKDAEPFVWSNYQDPQKPEFWDDGGEWIPPRPFREAAANPTKENLDAYLEWMQKKTAVVTRFQEALSAHVAIKESSNESNTFANRAFNWRRTKIIYVYQSSCSHCRASAQVIEKAKKLGAQVVFVQLDSARYPPLHSGSTSPKNISTSLSLETKAILSRVDATPTWIFEGKRRSTELTGELDFSGLFNAAQQFFLGEEI